MSETENPPIIGTITAGEYAALRAEVERLRQVAQDLPANLLHPEFGSEWQEPDGIIYKAVQAVTAERDALQRQVDNVKALMDAAPVMVFENGYPVRAVPNAELLAALSPAPTDGEGE